MALHKTMNFIYHRLISKKLIDLFNKPFVHIVFGARQTGKSTLIKSIIPPGTTVFDFSDPEERGRHTQNPGEFAAVCKALPRGTHRYVFVDEAQSVPSVFDAVQNLYDSDKERWRFILCGSSARKLRKAKANLLPGRSFLHHVQPLTMMEHPFLDGDPRPLVIPVEDEKGKDDFAFPSWPLMDRLAYGSLPGIVASDEDDRKRLLRGYVALHLEEEIRREALVRDLGAFLRFLRLAAVESGNIVNHSSIAKEVGVTTSTVLSHYQLLEDMFIGFSVLPYHGSGRRTLVKSPRFIFFDTGVRNAAAGFTPSADTVLASPGPLFEQWVGAELHRRLVYLDKGSLFYLRTHNGFEIDYIVEINGELIPIEVKWTEHPCAKDARNIAVFMSDHENAGRGYVVCRCPRPMELSERILAIPWWAL